MSKQKPNPNSIDPTDYPLNKVPQIVGQLDNAKAYPEESPIEEGIIEEQQGDLEGLDGENTLSDVDDEGDDEDAGDLQERDLDRDDA